MWAPGWGAAWWKIGDLRILIDASLLMALTANVGLTLRGEWRRDSRPPGDRKRDDLVFRTGITVSFQ